VTIYAAPSSVTPPGGLAAGELVIETEETTHATSIITYDTLGAEHVVTFTFTKTAEPNVWMWEAEVDDPAQVIGGNTGVITFNADGSLQSFDYDGGAMNFTFDPNNGAQGVVSIDLNAGSWVAWTGSRNLPAPRRR